MLFSSRINDAEHVIGDDNYQSYLGENVVQGQGMGRGLWPGERPFGEIAYGGVSAIRTLDEKEIVERAEELERKKERISDLILEKNIPCKNQRSTNYCWAFGVTGILEIKRVQENQPFISFSPASVAAPIKNFRNQGGWGDQAVEYMAKYGIMPSSIWPDAEISRQYYTEENKKLALNYCVPEFDDVSNDILAVATHLVLRVPLAVAFNWWSHLVYYADVVIKDGRIYGFRMRNSWSASWGDNGFSVLTGSKMYPNGTNAIRTTSPYVAAA